MFGFLSLHVADAALLEVAAKCLACVAIAHDSRDSILPKDPDKAIDGPARVKWNLLPLVDYQIENASPVLRSVSNTKRGIVGAPAAISTKAT